MIELIEKEIATCKIARTLAQNSADIEEVRFYSGKIEAYKKVIEMADKFSIKKLAF
jgi:hypothetical protein